MKRIIVLSSLVTSAVWLGMSAVAIIFALPSVVDAQAARTTAVGLTVLGADVLAGVVADVRPTGGGTLNILGTDGKTPRVTLGSSGSPPGRDPIPANAGIAINDLNGKQIGRLGTLDQVSPPVVIGTELRDTQNTVRYRASVGVDGSPTIQLFDADGNVVWSAP